MSNAQEQLNRICDALLGENHYITDPVGGEQANKIIADEIINKYNPSFLKDERAISIAAIALEKIIDKDDLKPIQVFWEFKGYKVLFDNGFSVFLNRDFEVKKIYLLNVDDK